jgi:acyl carrier protein
LTQADCPCYKGSPRRARIRASADQPWDDAGDESLGANPFREGSGQQGAATRKLNAGTLEERFNVTPEETLEKVLAFLREKFPSVAGGLTASTNLRKSVLLDSLAIMEVVMFLEESFDLSLERADLGQFDTPQAIADLVLRKGPQRR